MNIPFFLISFTAALLVCFVVGVLAAITPYEKSRQLIAGLLLALVVDIALLVYAIRMASL
jgi:quinol-cytochrome oxidoreductase complex cytochrome b subunit